MIKGAIPCRAGISLKMPYYEHIFTKKPDVPWFEVHAENLKSGATLSAVERIRQDYPLSLHGVGLSLGSLHLNDHHLSFLKTVCERLEPGLVSEHVAWNYVDGIYVNDLLPVPYTDEALQVLVDNIGQTQDYLKREILIENPSTYLQFSHSHYAEEDFIKEVARRSGCGILLDVNNVHVSIYNHGGNAQSYIKELAKSGLVKEIHLAGYKKITMQEKDFLVDHHGSGVSSEVWDLYQYALSFLGLVPTLIEWDNHLPAFDVLWAEGKKADFYMEKAYAALEVTAKI